MFQMFAQVQPTTNRGIGGLGLGLSLVKGIVEKHGGEVSVESKGSNQGSTFCVRLPLSTRQAAQSRAIDISTPRDPSSRRVLIVDDNRDAAASLALLLDVLGHDVRQAYSGQEAIDLVQSIEPEVIFMDIGMPQMDGLEATRRSRKLQLSTRPFIVALTGFGQEADRQRVAEAGIDEHLVKPAELNRIDDVLQRGMPSSKNETRIH